MQILYLANIFFPSFPIGIKVPLYYIRSIVIFMIINFHFEFSCKPDTVLFFVKPQMYFVGLINCNIRSCASIITPVYLKYIFDVHISGKILYQDRKEAFLNCKVSKFLFLNFFTQLCILVVHFIFSCSVPVFFCIH